VIKKKTTVDWIVLIAIGIFTAIVACVGLELRLPELGLDPSWEQALVEATDQGRIFGRDLIFTYGPLHQLATQQISANLNVLIAGRCLLGTAWFSASILLGCRCGNYAAFIYALIIALLNSRTIWVQGRADTLFILLATTGILLSVITPLPKKLELALLIVITSGILLSTFVKLSFIGIAIPSIACIALMPLFHEISGHERHAGTRTAMLIAIPAGITLLTWLLIKAGSIKDLWNYYAGPNLDIIQGYSEGMSTGDGRLIAMIEPLLYLASIVLLGKYLWTSIIQQSASAIRTNLMLQTAARVTPSISLITIAWVTAKASFVRHDIHAITAWLSILSISVLSIIIHNAICSTSSTELKDKFTLTICAVSGFTMAVVHGWRPMQEQATLWSLKNLANTLSQLSTNEGRIRLGELRKQRLRQLRPYAENYGINNPSNSTADTLPWEITDLLSQNLIYMPRPIPQSYSVYTTKLQKLNANYFSKKVKANRPQFATINLFDIDSRLPSGLDGKTIRSILSDYDYIRKGNRGSLIFSKCPPTSTGCGHPELSSTEHKGRLQWQRIPKGDWTSDKIKVPNDQQEAWLDLNFTPSLPRKLISFAWKAQPVFLEYLGQNGEVLFSSRIIPTASHSLLVFPSPASNAELVKILTNNTTKTSSVTPEKVTSLRLSSHAYWRPFVQTTFTLDEVKR
jgi:hypothetical protein